MNIITLRTVRYSHASLVKRVHQLLGRVIKRVEVYLARCGLGAIAIRQDGLVMRNLFRGENRMGMGYVLFGVLLLLALFGLITPLQFIFGILLTIPFSMLVMFCIMKIPRRRRD